MKERKCSQTVLARMRAVYSTTPFWRKAEKQIAARLRDNGIPCKLVSAEQKPWDIETGSGFHIECKAGKLLRGRKKIRKANGKLRGIGPHWQVSIARRGRLNETPVDFYVVYLTGCDDLRPVYLILKAPLRRKHLIITVRLLLTRYAASVNAWHVVREYQRAA